VGMKEWNIVVPGREGIWLNFWTLNPIIKAD
jgi:hypothetical protein